MTSEFFLTFFLHCCRNDLNILSGSKSQSYLHRISFVYLYCKFIYQSFVLCIHPLEVLAWLLTCHTVQPSFCKHSSTVLLWSYKLLFDLLCSLKINLVNINDKRTPNSAENSNCFAVIFCLHSLFILCTTLN